MRSLPRTISAQTRAILANAFIFTHIHYAAFAFLALPKYMLAKLHKLIMSTVRMVRGSYGYKVSTRELLGEFNFLDMERFLVLSSFIFIAKILKTGKPESLFAMVKLPSRLGAQVVPSQWPKINYIKNNFYFFKLLHIWNKMPLSVKLLDQQRMKRRARTELIRHPDPTGFLKAIQ